MNWIKVSDRFPKVGKLVYTKDANGHVAAFTYYVGGWNTKLSDKTAHDNTPIVEWLDESTKTEIAMSFENYDCKLKFTRFDNDWGLPIRYSNARGEEMSFYLCAEEVSDLVEHLKNQLQSIGL